MGCCRYIIAFLTMIKAKNYSMVCHVAGRNPFYMANYRTHFKQSIILTFVNACILYCICLADHMWVFTKPL